MRWSTILMALSRHFIPTNVAQTQSPRTLATCLESWFHCSCCSCYYYYHSSDICMDVYLKKSHGFVYMWPLLVPIPISAGARSWCTRWPGQIEIELRTLKSLWPKRGECYIPVGHTALLAGQKGDVEWLTGDSWTAAKLSSSARRFPRWQVLWQLLCPRVLTSLYLMFFLYYFFYIHVLDNTCTHLHLFVFQL